MAIQAPRKTLRSKVEPFLHEFFSNDGFRDLVPLLVGFAFYNDNAHLWIEFPEIQACRVMSDVIERNIYLLPYVIHDQHFIRGLEIDSQYRREALTIENVGDLMDVVEGTTGNGRIEVCVTT